MRSRRKSRLVVTIIVVAMCICNFGEVFATQIVPDAAIVSDNVVSASEIKSASGDNVQKENPSENQISDNSTGNEPEQTVSGESASENDTPSISENIVISENNAEDENSVSDNLALSSDTVSEEAAGIGATVSSGQTGDLTWTISELTDGNCKLTISGNGRMADYDYTYWNNDQGKTIYCTNAPWGKKYYEKITEFEIEEGCTYIGEYSFYNMNKMRGNLIFPASLKTVSNDAFCGCSGFTGLSLNEGLKEIGKSAFYGNTGFDGQLIIPNSVTDIGSYAFYNCYGFTGNLVIPALLKEIGYETFYQCKGFTGLSLNDGLLEIGEAAFYECSGFTGQLVIPNSVTVISYRAFEYCSGFTGQLVLSDNLKSIGNSAFEGCKGFSGELILPDGLNSIGGWAFAYCNGFTGSLTIPDGIQKIPSYTFWDCSGFSDTLTIPSSVKTIEDYAFQEASFSKIELDEGITRIGKSALCRSSGNEKPSLICNFPESLKSIDDYAFSYCFAGTVNIPKTLTQIGIDAFYSKNIEAYVVSDENQSYSSEDGVLYNKDKTIIISYPQNKADSTFTIPESVTSLARHAFYECRNLNSITVHKGVNFPYEAAISNFNSPFYLFMADEIAPSTAHASAFDTWGKINIYVPENAMGYEKKPWSDHNIIKGSYIKATEIRPAETDVVLDLNGSSYKDVYYSVLPVNATTKSIYIKNSNSSVAGVYSYKSDKGTYISISGKKQGTTTLTLITNDGFVSETIDVMVIKGSVKPDDDDDPTTKTDHTVIFKNDGTVYETQNVTDGGKVKKPADPAKSGYTFIGWANGNSLWNFTTPVTYDLVLIAKYAKETVSDNQSSGSGLDPKPEITEDKKIYLVVGQTFILNKKGFTSSNTKAVTVDKNKGKITAKAAGKGNAVISNGSESYTVIVQKPQFDTSYRKTDLMVGRSETLKLSGIESAYSAYYPISWQSSNEKLATVNNGVVTGIAKGKVNIYACVGGRKYSAIVNVKDTYTLPKKIPADGKININPLNTVTLKYDNKVFVPKNASWSGTSENALTEITNSRGAVTGYKNKVVEIYKSGKAKAIGAGTTTITGKDKNNKTVTLKINVNPISTKGSVYINVYKTDTIKFPKVKNSKAKWLLDDKETTNNGILEITSAGKIKGLTVGTTKVSCIYEGFTFETFVYVEKPEPVTDAKLTANGNKCELNLSKNNVYTVKLKDTYQTPVWSSKKNDIAFVDENGTVYARNTGKTTITTKINNRLIKIDVRVE